MQEFCTPKTLEYCAEQGQEVTAFNHPVGVAATDRFLMELSRLTGKPIPEALAKERGRLVDAIADSTAHLHGKKFALYGDPDLCLGLTGFLLELGAEPLHVLSTNGGKEWLRADADAVRRLALRQRLHAYAGKDLWHMRSLLFTEPVDFLIGNTYGKYLERDTGTPLIRIGFPIFDRHHHHRYPVWGYQGGLWRADHAARRVFERWTRTPSCPARPTTRYDIIRDRGGRPPPRQPTGQEATHVQLSARRA
jgi:nitrogenase molybdenum-iron protein beta chain